MARRWNPLIPRCLDGPLDGLTERLAAAWDELHPVGQFAVDHRQSLQGMGLYLEQLFDPSNLKLVSTDEEEMVFGTRFYHRITPDIPTSPRIPPHGGTLVEIRAEVYATLVEIGDLLAWAGEPRHHTPFPQAPFRPLCVSPRIPGKMQIRTPNRRFAAQLAQFVFFHRVMLGVVNSVSAFHPPMVQCSRESEDSEGEAGPSTGKAKGKGKSKGKGKANAKGKGKAKAPPKAQRGKKASDAAPVPPPTEIGDDGEEVKEPDLPFTQGWFYDVSGEAQAEGEDPHRASLAFLVSRRLEFRRLGRDVRTRYRPQIPMLT